MNYYNKKPVGTTNTRKDGKSMIYKVNFRTEETGELNNIYVGATSEQEALAHTIEILKKEPYSAFVEVICKTRTR